jgi:putative hemolysin
MVDARLTVPGPTDQPHPGDERIRWVEASRGPVSADRAEPSESGRALSAAASRVVAGGGIRMSVTDRARAARRALTLVAASVVVAGCGGDAATSARQLANPASENCVAHGGRLVIETAPAGQYGVCLFEDNRQCEEWALLRGACPSGGIKVTGYATPQARYCAIRGGDYAITSQQTASAPETGTCTLPGPPT